MENKDDEVERQEDEKKEKKTGPRSMLEDTEDEIEYRSISAMSAAPPAFGRAFGHMHTGPPSLNMPTPLHLRKAPTSQQIKKELNVNIVSIPMVDSTDYSNVIPKDLPPAPFRLELHSHFHVQDSSIQRVSIVIGQKLMDLGCDFIFKATKGKWKASKIVGTSMVDFNVTLYKTGGQLVVEFQRRQGDIVSMMNVYADVAQVCKKHQMLTGTGALKPFKHKRPAPSTITNVESSTQMNDTVKSIHDLLLSNYTEIQVQGILASISLSSMVTSYRDCMATLVPTLVNMTHSSIDIIKRCASFSLARLCDDPECRRAFMQSDGWELVVKLAAGGHDIPIDVQRESLHALENLCPLYAQELSSAEGATSVLSLLQDWQSIQDPRLKKHAYGAHQALTEAGLIA